VTVEARLTSAQGVDFGVFREASQLFLRKGELSVDGDLEHTGDTLNQLDFGAVLFFESRPRTEGSG
jgi:hypothetical protein